MIHSISIDEFLTLRKKFPVLDVRSPAEFAAGHIPGAQNLPLFSDDERKIVGTLYKQQGKDVAIEKGLEIAGNKMVGYMKQAKLFAPDLCVVLHCWRGGMRSESLAWLLSFTGFTVYLLSGGYRAYRHHMADALAMDRPYVIMSGKTGTGKSAILRHLQKLGEQVADLEGLAHHKGSAYGSIGEMAQPTTEQFENDLAEQLVSFNQNARIWLEDESRSIGTVFLPDSLYRQMKRSHVVVLDMPRDLRIKRLIADYAGHPKQTLADATEKISRKLGGQHAKEAIEAIWDGDYEKAVDLILAYYDKAYTYDLLQHDSQKTMILKTHTDDAMENAVLILESLKKWR